MRLEHYNREWLPHLTNEVVADARGWNLDAYVVALEGWRRGLTLRWHTKDSEKFTKMRTWFVDSPGRLFSLRSEEKTHYFFRTRGDKVTNEAVDLGGDKAKTKEKLIDANLSIPQGQEFPLANDAQIMAFAGEIGYPIVVKPTDGSFGRGVMTNITDEAGLLEALAHLKNEHTCEKVVVEQHIPGDDYRIYVVGDQAVAAMKRVPANVIGDGVHTVQQLINQKNDIRKENPRLISCPIQVDDELNRYIQAQGYSLNSTLDREQQLFLTSKSNISLGGDPISLTEDMPPEVMDVAAQALQSVPGLVHGAVDLIIDSRKPIAEAATIVELNPTAQLGGLLYPMKGKPNDVPAAIIDYYFPETLYMESDKEKMYFDFIDVLSPLESKSAYVSTVTPIPLGAIYAKRYTVIGDVQDIGYHMGLRKQAFERKLNGVVLNREDENIDVAVAGTDPEMVADFEQGLWADPDRSTVLEIHQSDWESPIKVGFEIKGDLKTEADQIEKLIKDIERTEYDLKIVEKEQKKYYDSFSWKISAPIRWIGAIFKQFRQPKI